MILYDSDPAGFYAKWLCVRIKYMPTEYFRTIARVGAENTILGVIGYDAWNGSSCQMHVAGVGNWLSRELLFNAFDYPFNHCKLECVIGMIPSSRDYAIDFSKRVGFTEVCRIDKGHPDGSLVLLTMYKEDCPWIGFGKDELIERAA